ncbi:MAG: hypothetical protein M3141_05045, partial [Actinomycetota bacterium]|nr:hypothetical protein [Actinomycetota bacterium]
MSFGDVSPASRVAFVVIVVLAIAWPVAGERVLDRLDAALSRDVAGCQGSGDRPPGDLRAAEAAGARLDRAEQLQRGGATDRASFRTSGAEIRYFRDFATGLQTLVVEGKLPPGWPG